MALSRFHKTHFSRSGEGFIIDDGVTSPPVGQHPENKRTEVNRRHSNVIEGANDIDFLEVLTLGINIDS